MKKKGIAIRTLVSVVAIMLLSPLVLNAGGGAPVGKPARSLAIEMGTPFNDHAILQREMKVPVWGWSKPGMKVTVKFAGQSKTAVAGKDGKWMLELDPLKANAAPGEMVISEEGGKTETLKDILVGEVWLASGQSNMQWLAGKCVVGRVIQKGIHERVKAGKEKMPIIREVQIPGFAASLVAQEKGKAQWSSDWPNFSAIAFAFAYEIEKNLKVPVGIVNCSFSSTPIQAWAHRDGFKDGKDEFTKEVYQKILEGDPSTPQHKTAWEAYNKSLRDWGKACADRVAKGLPVERAPSVPGNMRGNRDATWMYNAKTHPMAPFAIRGVIWNQGYANQNDGIAYRNYLHSLIRSWRMVWNKPELPVYFHQFYCAGKDWSGIALTSAAEMRLGTWLAHNDIPNAAMASQIDINGGVHYYNKAVPGQRLAYHALKNQYGKDIIANGPMYKNYTVKGDKLILELDHAEGLTVGKSNCGSGIATPTPIENGEDQVILFYIAGKDKKWHQAKLKIVGKTIELSAPGLKTPCGVAYGCNGVGTMPGIYNKAMLPLTPFIYFDNKLVVSNQLELKNIRIPGFDSPEMMTWEMEYIPLAGKVVDPTTYGIMAKYRKLHLLSPQFRDGAVIQADMPTRIYGAAIPGSVVKISFAGKEQTVKVGPNKSEWEATFAPLPANDKPTNIHVTCSVDGKLAHERKIPNIVIGDVWYVAINTKNMPAVARYPKYDAPTGPVRMFQSAASKRSHPVPDRFKMTSSGSQQSRFFARWAPPAGLAKELGDKVHAITGKPVGVIVMNSPGDIPIKGWVGYKWLGKIPAWKGDMDQLYSRYAPDPKAYASNAEIYIKDWQEYWKKVAVDPAFSISSDSGVMPRFPGAVRAKTPATMTYNMMIAAYGPANFKGVICFTPKSFIGEDEGASFGKEFSVMANCWKETFAHGKQVIDPFFVYTVPAKELAPKLTSPEGIKGGNAAVEIAQWTDVKQDPKTRQPVIGDEVKAVLDAAVKAVYK